MPKPRIAASTNAYLLDWCESEFRRYLHITDPGFLYVTLGAVIGNFFCGRPIWLMLVGPSGCGKTEMLMSLAESNKEWFRVIGDASKSSFLSGSSKRERTADATGGLLKEIANKNIRFIVFGEYGTILAQSKDDYNQITSMQREIWDGHVNRPVGSDGGKILSWSGKVGELAACTSRIDTVLAEEVACGVRWLLWRYPESETGGWQEAMKSSNGSDPGDAREALTQALSAVLSDAKLTWGMVPRKLSVRENIRITNLATFSSNLQGSIARDKYHREEVVDMPAGAYPTRLAPALSNIYLGMELIGLNEDERWKQIRKIAFDTAPALRVSVLKAFAKSNGSMDLSIMADEIRCGLYAVMRQMEDLSLLKILDRKRGVGGWTYSMTAATAEELKQL